MLSPGDQAPDFELPDQDGTPRRLSSLLADGPVVLFWYPAAMTPGCTKESCHFRDLSAEFKALGYPLLSDEQRQVADLFGVRRKRITPVKRATFVIGTDGLVKETVTSELRMDLHPDKALDYLSAHQG